MKVNDTTRRMSSDSSHRFVTCTFFCSTVQETTYNPADSNFTYALEFHSFPSFVKGSSIPSVLDVVETMQVADYKRYIVEYTWNAEPLEDNIFYETEAVAFNAKRVDDL